MCGGGGAVPFPSTFEQCDEAFTLVQELTPFQARVKQGGTCAAKQVSFYRRAREVAGYGSTACLVGTWHVWVHRAEGTGLSGQTVMHHPSWRIRSQAHMMLWRALDGLVGAHSLSAAATRAL